MIIKLLSVDEIPKKVKRRIKLTERRAAVFMKIGELFRSVNTLTEMGFPEIAAPILPIAEAAVLGASILASTTYDFPSDADVGFHSGTGELLIFDLDMQKNAGNN